MLYSNGYAGIIVSFIASSLLVYGFETPQVAQFKLYWWLAMVSLLVVRFADTIYWHRTHLGTLFDGCKSVYRFSTGTLLTAIMWCVYCLSVFPFIDTIELSFNIIIVSALAGGAATVLAAHKLTAMLYAAILLLPFSSALILAADFHEYILGVLGLSFGGVMLITAKKSADFTAQAIRFKNQNAVLVESMEEEVQERTKRIHELSNIDPLTGLFNRTAFLTQLHRHILDNVAQGKTFALLFIDLDGFKKINDTIGHETGDSVLKQTAARLKKHCPDQQLLCRWGGDEFLVGLDDATAESALQIATQLIAKISDAYEFENNRLSLGATVGVALYPEHTKDEKRLIQLADTAMYYQKKTSPSSAGMFSEKLSKRLAREQYLKDALSEALTNNQLRLVYQPIVNTQTHQIEAFEALLRWRLNGENIPPDEFIPIAEQYGQIRKIGAWVIEQACLDAKSWQDQNAISVSVNVSVIQLQEDDFIHIVDNALAASGLPAKCLHIEITESVFAADKDTLLNKINALQQRQVNVSIDDFGTKYSSLSVIQELSANKVKIDRSFIASLDTNGLPIVKAVLNIAEAFGYDVVAEGVETLQQAQTLKELGIHYLQGYYFAIPSEKDQLSQYLQPNALPVSRD